MDRINPTTRFAPLSLDEVSLHGTALCRPECVLCTSSGDIYTSDKTGGIRHLRPDGSDSVIGANPGLTPNGFAMLADGSFAVANLADAGGVWRIDRNGESRPMITEIDGHTLPSVNFVWLDDQQRLWICVSTSKPGEHRFRKTVSDGYLAVSDPSGTRIVAENIRWTNECRIDAGQNYLYVNETFGRRLIRFRIRPDASLKEREVVTEFGAGTYPDGMAIDEEGGIWVISVVSNRVIRVMPDGAQTIVLEDNDTAHIARLENEFQANRLDRGMVYENHSQILKNITSLAFGGPDRRTAYMGSINGESLAVFRSPVPGLAPVHWNW